MGTKANSLHTIRPFLMSDLKVYLYPIQLLVIIISWLHDIIEQYTTEGTIIHGK